MDYNQLSRFYFGSKTRIKILVLFVIGKKEEMYLREISRRIKVSAGNTRRELLLLEQTGLLKSRKEGNLRYFSLDKDNPLYRPFCEIIVKTAGLPELLKPTLKLNKHIIVAFIYGSFVKGGFNNESDIDLFVLTDKNSTVFEKISLDVDKFEQKFGREINVVIVEQNEFRRKLSENNSFISDIISGKKVFIKGGESEIRSQIDSSPKS